MFNPHFPGEQRSGGSMLKLVYQRVDWTTAVSRSYGPYNHSATSMHNRSVANVNIYHPRELRCLGCSVLPRCIAGHLSQSSCLADFFSAILNTFYNYTTLCSAPWLAVDHYQPTSSMLCLLYRMIAVWYIYINIWLLFHSIILDLIFYESLNFEVKQESHVHKCMYKVSGFKTSAIQLWGLSSIAGNVENMICKAKTSTPLRFVL